MDDLFFLDVLVQPEQTVGATQPRDDRDVTGDMDIRDMAGDLRVTDRSSDIEFEIEKIGGNFTVGADASGSIEHDRVAGTVQVPQQ